jgi:hypothetical protein
LYELKEREKEKNKRVWDAKFEAIEEIQRREDELEVQRVS